MQTTTTTTNLTELRTLLAELEGAMRASTAETSAVLYDWGLHPLEIEATDLEIDAAILRIDSLFSEVW